MDVSESTITMQNNGKDFPVKVLAVEQPSCVVIFAAGRGGSPDRHLSLLNTVATQGCTIVAPYFDMLTSIRPTKPELDVRMEQLETVIKKYSAMHQTIVGIGHSIGGTLLLALAGGKAFTHSGQPIGSGSVWKFERLALFAPPVDFFLHAGALESVHTQIHLRNGGQDTVTPVSKALRIKELFEKQGLVDFRLDEQAGHFSYMDELPPNVEDSQPNRKRFLADLAREVAQFVTRNV